MTNESRSFGFTYGYDDDVTAAMQERTYAWMDIIFVDFGEITGDCLLRKSRPAIVLSETEYNESSPILTVAPMTRSLKGLDSKYHVFVDREDCNNELNTSGMCMLEHCQAIDRRQVKHKMGHVYDERLQQKLCNGLAHHLQLMECIKESDRYVSI